MAPPAGHPWLVAMLVQAGTLWCFRHYPLHNIIWWLLHLLLLQNLFSYWMWTVKLTNSFVSPPFGLIFIGLQEPSNLFKALPNPVPVAVVGVNWHQLCVWVRRLCCLANATGACLVFAPWCLASEKCWIQQEQVDRIVLELKAFSHYTKPKWNINLFVWHKVPPPL